jgi:phenylacetate-coenzyme A ligase PaaK-like adenylate-forming protein
MSNIIETNNEFLIFLLEKSKNNNIFITIDVTNNDDESTRLTQKLQFNLENIIQLNQVNVDIMQISLGKIFQEFLYLIEFTNEEYEKLPEKYKELVNKNLIKK